MISKTQHLFSGVGGLGRSTSTAAAGTASGFAGEAALKGNLNGSEPDFLFLSVFSEAFI